jgi:hypothetical protein
MELVRLRVLRHIRVTASRAAEAQVHRDSDLDSTQRFILSLTMVQCVGCRQTLKNGKAYSNHQRACKEYKAAGALRLRQMQLNKAKKVERAQAIQLHITTDEEPNGLLIHDEHIQDLNNEMVAVSYLSNDFSRLTLEYRKKLILN